jgi:hypothetical protein
LKKIGIGKTGFGRSDLLKNRKSVSAKNFAIGASLVYELNIGGNHC